MNNILRSALSAALLPAVLFSAARPASAVLGNCWHIPDNTADLGINMRNPEFEIGTNTVVTVYQGLQKYNNAFGTANQTGGWLVYKGASQSSWKSNAFGFYSNSGQNQYWYATFNTTNFNADEAVQYYFYITFDGANGLVNTYLYGGGDAGGSLNTASQATAAAAPYTLRNRPAWIFHNGNRVIDAGSDSSHNNVECWAKVGYIGKDSSSASAYADNGRIYYTTDGTTPSGALGVPGGTTQVTPMSLDHTEANSSAAGNAMWWKGIITNAPQFTAVKYKIGLWHSSNNEEKFADYNAGTNNTVFNFSIGTAGAPVLTVNGVNADYTTTHIFVDEVAGDSVPLTVLFSPGQSGLTQVEVFSNVNRRDRATQLYTNATYPNGVESGIVPPDGNAIAAGDDGNYYKAYTMTATGTAGQYSLTLNATNCGSYRITARYKVSGNTNWFWYSSGGRRDHCVVVTPVKARNINLYELNAMTAGAQGTNFADRSTFTDLYGGPGSRPYDAVTNRINLNYLQNLGVNWVWFQPVHPIGIDSRQNDPNTGQPYAVGSPYAIKNFFEINPLMSKANTRAAALQEFTNFVAAADAAGVSVMLDEPFNHTAPDCELSASGVYYWGGVGNPNNWQATDEIRNREARVFSATNDYCARATGANAIAVAPDRGDFGKWSDVRDVFFGRYAALVCQNPSDNGNYLNEADTFDTSTATGNFDSITQNVWRYFSDCILFWLDKTGCPAGTPIGQTSKGIDGLRADFGQGLPPQCWEYIINKVRSRKWDFVFMTESLDGGAVTYRSNRHFDVLNENIVFPLQNAAVAADYRNIFEARRTTYGQSLVLLNNTSHDETNYADPFQALIRYAACSTIDGAPMIFYGQELGVSSASGFSLYEVNFGKLIAMFKTYNSLQPVFHNRANGVDYLWPVYAAINQARQFSPALRSSNRYFLDQQNGSGSQPSIYSVAKYQAANAAPNFSDVIFAFTPLDRNNAQSGVFNVNITQNGANLFGIKSNRLYNVKNISAYTAYDPQRRNYWLWNGGSGGTYGSNVLANGIYVGLNPVPASNAAWTNSPFEAQYLKLYDVTPPPAPAAPFVSGAYAGTNVTFAWNAVTDTEGGVSGYHLIVGTTPGGSNVFNGTVGGTNVAVSGISGQTLYFSVAAINNAGIEGAMSAGNSAAPFRILNFTPLRQMTWASVTGKTYTVFATTSLASNFTPISGVITAAQATTTFTDSAATNNVKFYRVQALP